MRSHAQTRATRMGSPRLAVLLATAAAFLLVPAGQAAAEHGEPHLTVNVIGIGGGGGEVISPSGLAPFPGTPPIKCLLEEGASEQSGVCENEMEELEPGFWGVSLERVKPAESGTPNSEFVKWEVLAGIKAGACTGSEATCTVGSEGEDAEVKAIFACKEGKECPEAQAPLTLIKGGSGDGTVSSEPAGINCEPGCEEETAEFEEGSTVTLTATPDGSSTFDGWNEVSGDPGTCTGTTSPCEITLDAAKEIEAEFNEVVIDFPSTLSVFKGGNGEGTVTSEPAGINCGAEPCEATFEEGDTIELEASPDEPGSAFAGWLGCHPVAGEIEKCEVTLDGPQVIVTAVFMAEGPQGLPGEDGKDGQNGEDGKDGQNGEDGKDGQNGQNGADGQNGQNGAAGPQGPQGKQGPPGKVTCKVKQKGKIKQKGKKKVKVTCTVKAGASSSRVGWRLMRGGKAHSHGTTQNGRLRLDLGNLREGRYVLRVQGKKGGVRIHVR